MAKVTKLAVLPSARTGSALFQLIRGVQRQVFQEGYDHVMVELYPPANRLDDTYWFDLAPHYQRFGLGNLRKIDIEGVLTVILEQSLKEFS